VADTVAVTTKGLGELRRDLRRLEPLVDRELRDALREAGEKVAITAGALAPRRSGALAHSIRPFVSGARVSIGSTLPYAGVVHWGGTIRPRGVPITFKPTEFVTRAAEDHADELVDDIGDGVERAARRAGWH
jgi:phage gpG-like protein